MRRRAFPLALLLVGLVATSVLATEQSIQELAPPVEQRVEAVGAGDHEADVQAVEILRDQDIGAQEPPSGPEKVASTAGKIALGLVAAGVSLGFTVASMLLF